MGLLEGFNKKPAEWKTWWIAMWSVFTPVWIAVNLYSDNWYLRLGSFGVLFLAPEIFSIVKSKDPYPPLTHAIRHFLPNWLAFPLIYATVGAISTRWLGFEFYQAWRVGTLMAILGWLTDHFTVTYIGEDPHPFSGQSDEAVDSRPSAL